MIFESNYRTYTSKGKAVPIWKLDTDLCIVYHYNEQKGIEDKNSFHSECIRCHIKYVTENDPDRIESLVNSGEILFYLENLEDRINNAIDGQITVWKETDKEYLLAAANNDNVRLAQLVNMFDLKAKETIYAAMVYV